MHAAVAGLEHLGLAGVASDDDHRHETVLLRRRAPKPADQRIAVFLRHLGVRKDEVERHVVEGGARLVGAAALGDLAHAVAGDDLGGDVQRLRVVVDQQEANPFKVELVAVEHRAEPACSPP